MGSKRSYQKDVSRLSAAERLEAAKSTIQRLTEHVSSVVDVHENNAVFSFSDKIAAQADDTYAGNAFNVTRVALTAYEALRTAALWDKPQEGTISIPTALALLDSPSVVRLAAKESFEATANRTTHFLHPNPDSEIQAWYEAQEKADQIEDAKKQRRLCIEKIRLIVDVARHARDNCGEIKSLLNTRHYIAHNLENTLDERRGTTFNTPQWQGVWNIQKLSLHIIEELYIWVNGVNYSIDDDCRRNARENANDFWGNATFNPMR